LSKTAAKSRVERPRQANLAGPQCKYTSNRRIPLPEEKHTYEIEQWDFRVSVLIDEKNILL
jgi:hypothetical protein